MLYTRAKRRSASTFVLHSVGPAHHSDARVPVEQLSVNLRGVLRLGGDDHDVVAGRLELVDRRHGVDVDNLASLCRAQRQTALVDGRRMRRSSDQRDLGSTLSQAPTDHAADCTSSEDDHTHARHRTGACCAGAIAVLGVPESRPTRCAGAL